MTTLERVRAVLIDTLHLSPGREIVGTTLLSDLTDDSLDHVEITMALEEEFDVAIIEEDSIALGNIQQIIDYIDAKQGRQV